MLLKRCSKCGLEKSFEEFSKKSLIDLQSWCQICNREQKKQWYANNREREQTKIAARRKKVSQEQKIYVWNYLLAHPCVDCGESDPLVLEFDHVRGKKKKEVGRMIHEGVSMKTLLDEIDKCEVRCANCHKRKTILELGWWKGLM